MEKSQEIDGVIIEFHQVGNAIKVSAIDTRSLLEVSIVAPAGAIEQGMINTVLSKLTYVQNKSGQGKSGNRDPGRGDRRV
jgi:hypothetical protein